MASMIRTGSSMEGDVNSEMFLQVVHELGGEATTTQIRDRTGLTNDEANYRFRKLDELDMIDIGYATTGHGQRNPPKVAYLTDKGAEYIEGNGINDSAEEQLRDHACEKRYEELEARIDAIEQRFDVVFDRLKSLEGFKNRMMSFISGS